MDGLIGSSLTWQQAQVPDDQVPGCAVKVDPSISDVTAIKDLISRLTAKGTHITDSGMLAIWKGQVDYVKLHHVIKAN